MLNLNFQEIQNYIILLKFLKNSDSQEINVQNVLLFTGDTQKNKIAVEIVIALENTLLLVKELEWEEKEKKFHIIKLMKPLKML